MSLILDFFDDRIFNLLLLISDYVPDTLAPSGSSTVQRGRFITSPGRVGDTDGDVSSMARSAPVSVPLMQQARQKVQEVLPERSPFNEVR